MVRPLLPVCPLLEGGNLDGSLAVISDSGPALLPQPRQGCENRRAGLGPGFGGCRSAPLPPAMLSAPVAAAPPLARRETRGQRTTHPTQHQKQPERVLSPGGSPRAGDALNQHPGAAL